MQGIGELIRKTREAKGISLAEVADATKIRQKYLEAIEREAFEVLPGEVYVKGFVNTYLKYLGIRDIPEVQAMLNRPKPQSVSQELNEASIEREKALTGSSGREGRKQKKVAFEETPLNKKGSMIILISVVAILMLLALQWIYTKGQQAELEDYQPVQQEQSQEQEQVQEPQTEVPDVPEAVVYTGLELRIEIINAETGVVDQSWMKITADGQSTELTMRESQVKTVTASESITLNLGNAGAVRIMVNGQDQGVQGRVGQVVRKTFDVKDYVTAGQ